MQRERERGEFQLSMWLKKLYIVLKIDEWGDLMMPVTVFRPRVISSKILWINVYTRVCSSIID